MTDAKRDNNGVTARLGVSSADGSTTKRSLADPTTHRLSIFDTTTGTNNGGSYAKRDANQVTAMIAASSSNAATPVALYLNSSGQLLVTSQ